MEKIYDIIYSALMAYGGLGDLQSQSCLAGRKSGIEAGINQVNKSLFPELKLEIINKVLKDVQSITSTAIEYGLCSDGTIHSWINRFKADGYVIIEKRGRSTTMNKKPKQTKSLEEMTPEEKNKYYEERLLYLEAENEYLKKLHAVVQARKNRQQKKK